MGRTRRQALASGDGREIVRLTAAGTSEVIERHAKTLTALMDARNSGTDVAKAADYELEHYRGLLHVEHHERAGPALLPDGGMARSPGGSGPPDTSPPLSPA
ncbi:hypothetical protein HCN51_27175 [Nonomuraea sp. FMUSA5-5]|uniref:Uncharacterized protein n=1 Tax=Nonomuraea composti TaxID=2720023 RepID=A0ABX1BE14_9ACTN|nr:hypothetical protein [Nonomuraea sp. FMUSA5-5]NJP93088.1 hypothetical protein [Nonomuraea sp. FMUSA5-5]